LKKSTEDVNPTKKRKLMLRGETSSNTMSPPWVMAPPKVLRYLDVLLGCKHGFSLALKSQTFLPFLHHDPTIPIGPWTKFQNIKVYHNCCPSWGLLIRIIDGSTTSWLCYSGDTRPCKSLVQACRLALSSKGESLLLIHEATFEEMEKGKAYLTKHSTIREALSIASQIPASRVLLTHFSQRYIGVDNAESGITLPLASNTTGMPIGYAIDGLKVPI
jgi:ribonuclease BN (tRNA processing enzyme)